MLGAVPPKSVDLDDSRWVYLKIKSKTGKDLCPSLAKRDQATILSQAESDQMVGVASTEFPGYRWLAVPRAGKDKFVVEGERRLSD